MNDQSLLEIVVKAADDKRAEDILALNLFGVSLVADYFVICHGNSNKQVQAIADEVKEQALIAGFDVRRVEGFDEARWVLVDLGDVIVHIFHQDERSYYSLERLWGDAKRESLDTLIE